MEALSSIAAAMTQGEFKPFLLYGITGSGKTSVYFAAMQRALDAGKSALLLVPEIGLTPAMAGQMFARVRGTGGTAPFRADAGRARRAVAPHPPRRGAHRGRHALRCLRADGRPRAHPGR